MTMCRKPYLRFPTHRHDQDSIEFWSFIVCFLQCWS